uniref:Rhomboid domain-containing protein 3 n=1 Tax=Geotrypetes seraphini TaxID=260995 RepID=A0A6P8S2A1_GEOSA|nr:rhomboid domain-containing protein 3 [Geotrypetes seraphini]
MQLRVCLRGISRLEAPPVASLMLMVLLCCLGLMDCCETLALKSDQLLQHFQVHRLLTYPLCSVKPSLLLLDLLLFLLLGWWQEQRLGTLQYLYLALLSTITSALLYLLLMWLWTLPHCNACGYTTVHLAMLTAPRCQPPALRWGLLRRIWAPALPWLLLLFIYLSFSDSPSLLYLSGVVSGLACILSMGVTMRWEYFNFPYSQSLITALSSQCLLERLCSKLSRTFFTFLEDPCYRLCWDSLVVTDLRGASGKAGEASHLPHALRTPFVHFIPSPKRGGILPEVDPTARSRSVKIPDSRDQTTLQGSFPASHFPNLHSTSSTWSSPTWPQSVPFADLVDPVMDEVFLRAGIQASLEEFSPAEPSELKLSRSSVSSLRLQQLEKMGFPTDQAVVALAATGKVEGAVSLLVEGQVGDEILVTPEGRPHHVTCDARGPDYLCAE